MSNNNKEYGAKVTIDLIDLGNTTEEAAVNVNKFLDWCDEASSVQGFVYETTDYEILEYKAE